MQGSWGLLLVGRDRHLHAAVDELHRAGGRGVDVEVEDLGGQPQRGAGVGHVDHTADVALHRRCAEDGVGLGAAVAELLQVLDSVLS